MRVSGKGYISKIQRRVWKEKYPSNWREISKQITNQAVSCSQCSHTGSFTNPLQSHHIIPLSRGGSNSLSNLQCLCKKCHNKKHRKGQ